MKNLVSILLLVACAVAGMVVFYENDAHLTELSRASHDWPSVRGVVVSSNLEARRRSGAGKRTKFQLEVSYEYAVDGEVFRSGTVRFDQDRLSTQRKSDLLRTVPVGQRVDVYYNPENPGESVLQPGSYAENG